MWRRWVELTSRTESGVSIAMFRVAVGLCVLLSVSWIMWAGLVDVLLVDYEHGGASVVSPEWLVRALGGPTPFVMWGLCWATLGSATLMTLGLGGRITALVTLQLVMAVVDTNVHAGGSYDELMKNALWLCVLAPTTTTHSVDCRLRTGHWSSSDPVGVWARYLIVLQLVLMYGSTGYQKVSAYWTPGGDFSALYYILQQPSWQRFDMRWVAPFFPLTQVATAVSWFWEVLAPVWLLSFWASETAARGGRLRDTLNRYHVRVVFAVVGALFHFGIAALLDVGPFTPLSLAFYAALVHPWEWPRRLAGRAASAA